MNWAAFTSAVIGSVMLMGAGVVWLGLVTDSPALGSVVFWGFIVAGPILLLRGESISATEWLTLIAELTPELTYFRGKVYR